MRAVLAPSPGSDGGAMACLSGDPHVEPPIPWLPASGFRPLASHQPGRQVRETGPPCLLANPRLVSRRYRLRKERHLQRLVGRHPCFAEAASRQTARAAPAARTVARSDSTAPRAAAASACGTRAARSEAFGWALCDENRVKAGLGARLRSAAPPKLAEPPGSMPQGYQTPMETRRATAAAAPGRTPGSSEPNDVGRSRTRFAAQAEGEAGPQPGRARKEFAAAHGRRPVRGRGAMPRDGSATALHGGRGSDHPRGCRA